MGIYCVFGNFTMGVVHAHGRRFGRVDTADTKKSLISGGTTPKRMHTRTHAHTHAKTLAPVRMTAMGKKYV